MVFAGAPRCYVGSIQGANRLDSAGTWSDPTKPGQDARRDAGVRRSQSFNVVNQLRVLGRWMRMFTIQNQSSAAKPHMEFDAAGRMKPSAYYDRVVDVMEELVKFTLLLRDQTEFLVDRYSERKESAGELSARVNQGSI